MYIPRHIAKVIVRQSKRKPVIILTGPRQAGKSTLLKILLQNKRVKYVLLDNPTVREIAIENPSRFLEMHRAPVVLDEVQKAPKLFEYIKEIVDAHSEKKGQYYLTGSQSFRLMQNISESLAGRAGIISMLGLSLREINRIDFTEPFKPDKKFISAYPKHTKNNYKDIADIIHKGCMPELYAAKSNLTDWADYYSAYFQTYIERDIRAITNIQNTSSFIKFVKAAAALTGERLNYVTLANICGMDVTTVKRWISILETSGLVYILQPYYNNFNKRITKTPKLYFLDTGLVCFLGGWNTPQQLVSGARWGHIFETFVVSEVLKSYYNNGALYPPLCYYRDKEKNEIDLIIEDGDILYPVEIKTSSDPDKGMVKNFEILNKIPAKIIGAGALICLAKQLLPLTAKTTAIPADKI